MKKAVLITILLLISSQTHSTEYQEWVCSQGTQKNFIEWDERDPISQLSFYWVDDYRFFSRFDIHYEMLRRISGPCKSQLPKYSIFDKSLSKKWTIYSDKKAWITTCAYVCEQVSEELMSDFSENLEAKVEVLLDQIYIPNDL